MCHPITWTVNFRPAWSSLRARRGQIAACTVRDGGAVPLSLHPAASGRAGSPAPHTRTAAWMSGRDGPPPQSNLFGFCLRDCLRNRSLPSLSKKKKKKPFTGSGECGWLATEPIVQGRGKCPGDHCQRSQASQPPAPKARCFPKAWAKCTLWGQHPRRPLMACWAQHPHPWLPEASSWAPCPQPGPPLRLGVIWARTHVPLMLTCTSPPILPPKVRKTNIKITCTKGTAKEISN